MDKKILCIVVSMLMCATAISVAGTGIYDKDADQVNNHSEHSSNRDMWDVQFQFPAGADTGSQFLVGIVFDGTYFYCPEFNSGTIYRFDHDGVYIDSFVISGIPNLLDLCYDGQYAYGAAQSPGNVIYILDLANQVQVGQINAPGMAWNIAYDAEADGGNGGFWIGQWQTHMTLIDRNGQTLDTIDPVPDSVFGFAWDPWTKISRYDGPFLWVFSGTSTGMDGVIKVIDLATKTLIPDVEHNVADELGPGMAGGLELTTTWESGKATLYGMAQGTTDDYAFGYEIATTNLPPETPAAPTGPSSGVTNVEYTFTAVTTDPEEEQVYYTFDWGDDTTSEIGPFNSGQEASASHMWTQPGNYDVKVMARDVNDGESEWSEAHTINIILGPVLEIGTISGGLFKVTAIIRNTGEAEATDVEYEIKLTGGAFIGGTTTGTIPSIPAGMGVEIESKLIIGLGATTVTVTATNPLSTATGSADGFIFIIFVNI
jgi:hypothetical protein